MFAEQVCLQQCVGATYTANLALGYEVSGRCLSHSKIRSDFRQAARDENDLKDLFPAFRWHDPARAVRRVMKKLACASQLLPMTDLTCFLFLLAVRQVNTCGMFDR